MSDLVAIWEVPLSDKVHKIEFEHGTTTGKRIVRVDGEEIIKREWMFKLVGSEVFEIKGHDEFGNENDIRAKCEIIINAATGFTYEYSLLVNGKHLKKFREKQSKIMRTWLFEIMEQRFRVTLEKDTLDVWVNGEKAMTTHEFAEEGTEIHFVLKNQINAIIKTISSGNKKEGIVYVLIVNNQEISPS